MPNVSEQVLREMSTQLGVLGERIENVREDVSEVRSAVDKIGVKIGKLEAEHIRRSAADKRTLALLAGAASIATWLLGKIF